MGSFGRSKFVVQLLVLYDAPKRGSFGYFLHKPN